MIKAKGYGFDKPDNFFPQVDAMGGWPLTAKSIVMKHGQAPFDCYFSQNENVSDGWNTTLFTSDDYYLWKLSEKAKETLRREGYKRAKDKL